jgi:hypothetical protein
MLLGFVEIPPIAAMFPLTMRNENAFNQTPKQLGQQLELSYE